MTEAERRIRENIRTRNPYLDLGRCGLTGKERILSLLKECTWLDTLSFANSWHEFDEGKQDWTNHISQNEGEENNLCLIPPYLPKSLRKLVFGSGQIADISSLPALTNLNALYLISNQLADASFLSFLTGLTYLDLRWNQLTDVSSFASLTNLKRLYLDGNQITDVSSLATLKDLAILDVNCNRLTNMSLALLERVPKLQALYLHGNPLKFPPEVFDKFGNVLHEVRDYLQSIAREEDRQELNEAKLLIVGVGEVGKSEIVEALSELKYKFIEGRRTTHGIRIKEWHIPCLRDGKEQDFRVNIWDFAGQEINYGTHQFFLTQNSVYIFLWEPRKGELQSNFEYWLNIVSLLSENAPIFVVQNKIDIYKSELNQENWQKKFPHIAGFYKTSCKTGEGIAEVRKDIMTQLTSLPSTRKTWNKHRYAVRRILEGTKEDYIEYKDYLKVCEANTLTKEEAGFLAKQLHDIGVILRHEDIALRDTVVLNPTWATDAAYCLLDTKMVQEGQFSRQDLVRIWAEGRFEGKYGYLLELMQRFELIFQFHNSDTYIVPEGLPAAALVSEEDETPPTLRFEYHYEFMPRAILSRFICRVHHYIKDKFFWRFGVVLTYDKEAIAHVRLNDVERILQIKIWGQEAGTFLQIIRSNIDHIHQDLKNPPLKEKVPCMCEKCKNNQNPFLHDYSILLEAQKRGKDTRPCDKSFEDVPISDLLQGFTGKRDRSAIEYLDRADIAGFFKVMRRKNIRDDLRPTFEGLQKEYISGKTGWDFENRLRAFAAQIGIK